MFNSSISQAPTGNQAQRYLEHARQQKAEQNFEAALVFYNQAKVAFKNIADIRQVTPTLSQLKSALTKAQTSEDAALRQRIAEVYAERAELLAELGKPDKAQTSRKKAQAWGYQGTLPISIAPLAKDKVLAQPITSASTPAQQVPILSSAQDKNILINYLFEKALSTLSSLEISNKPSLFFVYAHDNDKHGEAHASISTYLISKLSQIRVNLYSDQAPKGEPYASSLEDSLDDGKIEDIVTNQLCLLPELLRADVKPVDKVIVFCSEVLGSYLQWTDYEKFCQELHAAYLQDREAYRQEGAQSQSSAVAIREVVRKFSLDPAYKDGFHHVLTEIAFLQIRKEQLQDQHGIIPVALTPDSYQQCLLHFISPTTVRVEDILFEPQTSEVGTHQSLHRVLFKLIERVLIGSDEARTFLNKFWQGYSDCLARLDKGIALDELAFVKLVDSIFDGIRAALHSRLVFTVQQQQQQLRLLNADPKMTLKAQYDAALKQDQGLTETLQLYVEPRGKAADEIASLSVQVQVFLQSDKQVLLLTGESGAGKSTFNRILEKQLWKRRKEVDHIPLFIALPTVDHPEQDLIAKALKKRGLSELQIQKLKKEKQRFIFILDGYDELRQTQNLYLSNQINQPGSWLGKMVISCRTEYLGQHYQSRFQPNPALQEKDTFFEEVAIEPFSIEERDAYLKKYVILHPTGWTAQQYQEALEQPHIKDLAQNPFLLRVTLEALPYLADEKRAGTVNQLRLDLYDQFVKQWFERNEQRLSTQDLTESKREIFRVLCDEGFADHGIVLAQDLAVHLYTEQAGNPVVEYSSHKNKGSWKESFFGREEEKQLLREAWPLTRSGNQYRFIHKSLLEYFVSRALFDSFDACLAPETRSRRGSNASAYSFEDQPVPLARMQQDVSLAPKHWVGDLGVVQWLTERVEQGPIFKDKLFKISVVYSPNGQQIASGSSDNKVQLWDAQTGQLSHTLAGHTDGVLSVVYSPSGQQIASGSVDNTVRLWDAQNGQCLAVMRGFVGTVNSIAWKKTISGAYLVTGCEDKSVRVWQIIEDENHVQARLHWSSAHDRLTVTDMALQDVRGLSAVNKRLLKQRGAVGESLDTSVAAPSYPYAEPPAKLITSTNKQLLFSHLA